MDNIHITSSIRIRVNGNEMARLVGSNLIEALVDQHAHLPSLFELRLFDPRLELLDGHMLNVGDEIEIGSVAGNQMYERLILGEISSLEPIFGRNGAAEIQVRGYDFAYRLFRNVQSCTYLNIKDSDLARKIAETWGLNAEVDNTTTVYDHVYQRNESDLAFLLKRAARIGFECYVRDETLYFRKPKPSGSGVVTLTWTKQLLSFVPRMNVAEQVNEVVVRGWDAVAQKPIVGRAKVGKLFAKVADAPQEEIAREVFGSGKLIIVDQPVATQAEADILAEARMDELSGAFVSAEGIAFREPRIRAGSEVQLKGMGRRFSGVYLVTNAQHTFSAGGGLETKFEVRGTRRGLIAEQMNAGRSQDRWFGIYTALVTNNNDPQGMGRVKVRYPWLDEDGESDWVRVATMGASADSGFMLMPSVGDQVLIAFEQGDFARPILTGSLGTLAGEGSAENGRTTLSQWRSPNGSAIAMHDSLAEQRLELTTQSGHSVKLDESAGQLVVTSAGGQTITLDDRRNTITIASQGNLTITSKGNIDLNSAMDITMTAAASFNVRALRKNI